MTSDDTAAIAALLGAWIWDENRVVTAKILARHRPIHINTAKRHLAHFAQQATAPLDVIYGLSGRVQNRRTVAWVSSADLARAQAAFQPLTSQYVEAVGRAGLITPHGLFTANRHAIHAQPHLNTYAAIHDRRCVPRASPILPSSVVSPTEPPTRQPSAVAGVAQASLTPAVSSPAGSSSVAPAGPKHRGRIAGLFAQAARAPRAPPPVPPPDSAAEELSPGQENRLNEAREAQKVSPEPAPTRSQKRGPQKSRPATASQSKRRRIKVMSDSDSSEAEVEPEPVELAEMPAPPQARLIESDDDDELIPPTPEPKSLSQPATTRSTAPGRRRVRRLVNQTFTDDQGFTVTKKAMESASETDDETSPNPSANSKDRPVLQPKNKQAPKSVVHEPGKVKQASIMNFFQKKTPK
ncbi:hypothetical protein TCAL_01943 [Tigriopus californicus]|uniref:DNA polymerase delta subunit 3 n=1 Tax=Tigriopus californicus TaxID=6832 RepID=A0A553P7X0_TIGCA|nr:DNA polymerase delta subunit 3-like [Tigriopus californicus]TRY73785.1 hypothetical protein TCAL_01943 [Tigriopus californicus]|eukprot:TCALIF_01943-PA protein Name:"Similar to POLD3 DNA polymerase delta subunit 3 (Bos taurus)" AED:0.23 eAED:0.23 QI:69/1/1/1/1/1/3/43/409